MSTRAPGELARQATFTFTQTLQPPSTDVIPSVRRQRCRDEQGSTPASPPPVGASVLGGSARSGVDSAGRVEPGVLDVEEDLFADTERLHLGHRLLHRGGRLLPFSFARR